jgi:hypothetical protein
MATFQEMIVPDEPRRFEAFAREIAAMQAEAARGRSGPLRVLHVKQHVGLVGTLEVKAVEGLRAGVFARERSFPVYVRLSNGAGRPQTDGAPDVRGFAIKLVGVSGRKLIPELAGAETQDFLFINDPIIPFRTPDEFMAFQRAAKHGPLTLLPRLIAGFGFRRAFAILRSAIKSPKVGSYSTHTFHTAAPLAIGDQAAKLALFPRPTSEVAPSRGADYLRSDIIGRLKAGPLSWSLRAQLYVDETTTPIEDTSILWTGPWHDLATLTIPRQDPDAARGKEISALVTQFSFDPWHAIEEHRPLGAIMRARRVAYAASVIGRKAAPEPTTVLPA